MVHNHVNKRAGYFDVQVWLCNPKNKGQDLVNERSQKISEIWDIDGVNDAS